MIFIHACWCAQCVSLLNDTDEAEEAVVSERGDVSIELGRRREDTTSEGVSGGSVKGRTSGIDFLLLDVCVKRRIVDVAPFVPGCAAVVGISHAVRVAKGIVSRRSHNAS